LIDLKRALLLLPEMIPTKGKTSQATIWLRRPKMKRLALALVAAGVLAAPAAAANCAKDYKDFWDRFAAGSAKQLSPEQLASANRIALRGYDACMAGDERFTPEDFWKKMDQSLPAMNPEDFWKDMEKRLPAKKQ
jgi:hypothetical protein